MEPMKLLAQAVGILAMLCAVISFQGKRNKSILWLQFLSNLLFLLHYTLLGAAIGAMMNVIAVIRSQVYLHRERLRTDRPIFLIGFIALYLLSYVLQFTVFGKEPSARELFFSALVIIASIIYTVGFHINDPKNIRKYNLIGAPLGLAYNLSVASVGACCMEVFKIVSILTAMLRLDRDPDSAKEKNNRERNKAS